MIETYHVLLNPPFSGDIAQGVDWQRADSFEAAKRRIWTEHPRATFDADWLILTDRPQTDREVARISAWGAPGSDKEGKCVAYIQRLIVWTQGESRRGSGPSFPLGTPSSTGLGSAGGKPRDRKPNGK